MTVYNFSPGPAVIFPSVLQQLQQEITNYKESGYSLLEASHRGALYEKVHEDAITRLKALLGLTNDYDVLLLGGGATLQWTMIACNFLTDKKPAHYIITGAWGSKAFSDAQQLWHYGPSEAVYDGAKNSYTSIPDEAELHAAARGECAYAHIVTNETIHGVQWNRAPRFAHTPLVADMSSDILSRPIDIDAYSMIYAGAQKNIGPAGVTVAVLRKDFLETARTNLPSYLSYKIHADAQSLYNTPPVFSIWAVSLVLEHIQNMGGLPVMAQRNREKADALYKAIDTSGGFYRCPVTPLYRSVMNVVFRLPSEELEAAFLSEASKQKFIGLKGHRNVGGCRASIYNAMSIDGVQALASFMSDFCRQHG